MTPLQRFALLESINPLWAEETLRDRGGSLSSKQLYHMVLLATGDPVRAADARARRALEELHRGQTPDS